MTKRYPSVASLRADLAAREAPAPFFELLDQALLEDGWSWEYQNGSLELGPAARPVSKRPAPPRRSKRRM